MNGALHLGDCLEVLRGLPDGSVDAVVTDPPYGINFMGKAWDGAAIEEAAQRERASGRAMPPRLTGSPDNANRSLVPRSGSAFANRAGEAGAYDFSPRGNRAFQAWVEAWAAECLRVLKPGGHLLSFGGTRTYHRLTCGIEDAGFEIRDQLAWLFGQGFPKSHNLDGGLGTALKPAHEPIAVARKPLAGTVAANVAAHGTGALNIDACRIEGAKAGGSGGAPLKFGGDNARPFHETAAPRDFDTSLGRWPANVLLDETAAAVLDEQTGESVSRIGQPRAGVSGDGWGMTATGAEYADRGGASRFFYCAKVGRAERNAGLDGFKARPLNWSSGEQSPGTFQGEGTDRSARNHHPTVKPIDLMRWLIRLVTPPGGLVLDPFLGSGSTGCAAALEARAFIGIEREPDYMAIAAARIAFWQEHGEDALNVARTGQLGLFGGAA